MEYIEPRHSQCPQTRVIKCQSPKQHVYRSMVSCFSDQTPWISSESKPWHPTLPKMVGWWMLIPQSYQAPYGIGYSPGDSMGLNQKPRLHQTSLVGGFQPGWKIWKSVGIIIPDIWKNRKCSKPPTSGIIGNSFWSIPEITPFQAPQFARSARAQPRRYKPRFIHHGVLSK